MSKLIWYVKTAGTDETVLSGTADSTNGVVRIHPSVPAGVMEKVSAVISHKMSDDEKVFMNGYQTWTYCPEYGKNDRETGLTRPAKLLSKLYSFDRYGDYHFVKYPKKAGIFHGFSYCYFRRGDRYSLVASLDERPGYTIFRYDSEKGLLFMERDCKGVEHKGVELQAFDLYFAEGTEDEVFSGWFDTMGIKLRTTERLFGYSSWYNRYEDITYEAIASDLKGCKLFMKEGDLFQIDDGWEKAVGDWLAPDRDKFPVDMADIVSIIHASGFKAGLWIAPFVCEKDSEICKEHPNWLLRADNKPWKCGSNWSGFYSLDIDNAEVQKYLEKVFDRVLNEWGFDLVKLDFLYGAAPFGTETESRAGRMIRAMEMLRKWCGDKLILGCGVPVMPAFGLVDYCRVSCDVSLDWDDKWYMRLMHRERISTKQAISNTIYRRQLNGRAYLSDPDVFFLRDENIYLSEEQKETLAKVNALMGGILLTSDDMSKYTPEKADAYRKIRELNKAENVRVNTDNGITVSFVLDGKECVFKA